MDTLPAYYYYFQNYVLFSLGNVEKHGPDASDHLADDFDLWEEATGRRKNVI